MAVVADVTINMQADIARMQSDLEKVTKTFDKMKKSIDVIKTASLVQLGQAALRVGREVLQAAESVYTFSRNVASMGNDIQRSAQVAGMGVEQFQKWQYVAKMSDVESQSLAQGMKLLSKNMSEASQGSGKAAEAFKAMGIDVKSSTGGLKSLDEIMREMAGKFSQWEDGPEKIALSLAVFGRAGEALIPMLNKGKTGIEEFEARLEKLGGTISGPTLDSLSKSEDAFKDWDVAIRNLKLNMAPLIELVASLIVKLTELIKLRREWADIERATKTSGMGPGAIERQMYEAIEGQAGEVKAWQLKIPPYEAGPYAHSIGPPITKAPGMVDIEKEGKLGTFKDPLEAYREQSEEYKRIVDRVVAERTREEEELQREIDRIIKEGQATTYETWKAGYDRLEQLFHERWRRERTEFEANEKLKTEIAIEQAEQREKEEQEIAAAYYKAMTDTNNKKIEEERKAFEAKMEPLKSLASSFISTWDNAFTSMMTQSKKFKDVFVSSVKAMGMAFIHEVNKMIAQWIMFQAIKAATGGIGGVSGAAIPGTGYETGSYMQAGGVVSRPTHAILGEAGPEAVIPLKNGAVPVKTTGGSGSTYVFISSPDAEGVLRLFQQNSGAMVSVLQDHLDNRGPLVDSIRGVL